MDLIVEEIVDPGDLKKFEIAYKSQEKQNCLTEKAEFDYAWCLVRSRYKDDTKFGITILEDLYRKASVDEQAKRDYIFYLAIGYTRLKEYDKALKLTKGILHIEPNNRQAKDLEKYINKKMKTEGFMGAAIIGGVAAVAIGGLVSLGLALGKKSTPR